MKWKQMVSRVHTTNTTQQMGDQIGGIKMQQIGHQVRGLQMMRGDIKIHQIGGIIT